MGAIPISSHGSPKEILSALREAGRRLDDGELVCIFPEGQITRTGNFIAFSRRLHSHREGSAIFRLFLFIWIESGAVSLVILREICSQMAAPYSLSHHALSGETASINHNRR